MNVNSVPLRIDEINDVLVKNKIDIFGLAETRFKSDTHFIEHRFPGYLICRAKMNVELISCFSEKLSQVRSDIAAEFYLFLDSSSSVDPILVLVVYRPPSSAS